MTTRLQQTFFGLFEGKTEDRWGWLEDVEDSVPVEKSA
jgi:branched-chain amino acid aminotransferase